MSLPRRRSHRRRLILSSAFLAAVALMGAITANVFGVGDKWDGLIRRIELTIDPPPDRPIEEAVHVTPRPSITEAPRVTLAPGITADPDAPSPTPTPAPRRVAVDVNLLSDPEANFKNEIDNEWCAVAGTQIVLHIWGKGDLSSDFQRTLASRIGEWESRRDSKNGGWGPAAMVRALRAYGVPGYQVRAYDTRADALRDAATAISEFHAPVLLLAWKGAHTWVMTGYRANADPLVFDDARVTGAYILDPWFPRVSSIWPRSLPPGAFHDASSMHDNFLPWKRPEGLYQDRDGLFIAVVPTVALEPGS